MYKFAKWEEDAFRGKPVSDLQKFLEKHNQILGVDPGASFSVITGRKLSPNQRLMRFDKGEGYPWFPIGSANNMAYVVIEDGPDGPVVVEIVRSFQVDSF
jgi:hypothetical protein